jgi:hypothetical protein
LSKSFDVRLAVAAESSAPEEPAVARVGFRPGDVIKGFWWNWNTDPPTLKITISRRLEP